MALTITHAILHVLNNSGADSHFSKSELDIDSETCYEFISKHVRRLMTNPSAKEAVFVAESPAYSLVRSFQKGDIYFKDFSVQLCERLLGTMKRCEDIPSGDVLVTAFENGQSQYIAIIKLNYIECFTHKLIQNDVGSDNQIIKNTVVLPAAGGKVEEAVLIPYDPMVLRVLEKSYPIDGEDTAYFSKLFLECETEVSKKETADIIRDVTEEIGAKYFDGDIEMAARVKYALIEEAEQSEDEGSFVLENVARKVFADKEDIKSEFIAMAQDMGLPHEVKLDKSFVKQQFKTQTFRADNGIEIKCPCELFSNPDTIQFVTNGDGSVSITLKNLRRC